MEPRVRIAWTLYVVLEKTRFGGGNETAMDADDLPGHDAHVSIAPRAPGSSADAMRLRSTAMGDLCVWRHARFLSLSERSHT